VGVVPPPGEVGVAGTEERRGVSSPRRGSVALSEVSPAEAESVARLGLESRKVDRSGMPQVRTEPQEKEVIPDESEA
jgi:hypothetical protein